MYRSVAVSLQRVLVYFSFVLFTACGGGSSSGPDLSQDLSQPQYFIAGGGVKGPLAFASVELYALNMEFVKLYEPGNPITTATTNAYAEITGLSVPIDRPPPYVLIIDGTNAIDQNTGIAPVIKKLVTIITREALESGQPVYATPYTTLAYHALTASGDGTSSSSVSTALAVFNEQIIQSIGFGISAETDIFTTAPIITEDTKSVKQQELVVNYRAAIEALSAMLHEMFLSSSNGVTTDTLLLLLALDLRSDGVIDGTDNGLAISGIDMDILSQDPMSLKMPNTRYYIRDIVSLIDEERAVIGGGTNTIFLKEELFVNLQALSTGATNSSDLNSTVENPIEISYSSSMGELTSTLLATGLIASGPIVISGESDVVISGLHVTNPNGSCVEILNASTNIVIENSEIGPCKDMGVNIVESSKVTIRNSYIHDTKGVGIRPYRSSQIQVISNEFERVSSGVHAAASKQIDVSNNFFKNIQGPFPRGQLVQFEWVSGYGNRINNNIGINELGASDPQDALNVYKSNGKPDDYIQINGNVIVGGGPSISGGGIILGDSGGSYQIAKDNILVNPGGYGISLSAGRNLILRDNKVFNGNKDGIANNGIVVGYQAETRDFECRDLEISNNEITWWRGKEQLRGAPESYLSPYYKWSGCGTVTGWNTNKLDTPKNQPANLDASILPAKVRALQ